MWGISWGGFNSLQIAARRPPGLGAIMTLCSTDDRYADDVHYRGGCVLALDMLHWASSMLTWNARPPDPRLYGDGWREAWLERLETLTPWIEPWLGHQRRDAYWKHGSVCEDYAAIECPVYAVGGFADGYTNAVPRLLAGLSGPRKGIIGPWAHDFPENGKPGPSIGFLQESVRWFDHWLKGVDTGVMDEPMLRVWMQDSVAPQPSYEVRPGRWVAEPSWPSPNVGSRVWELPVIEPRELLGVQSCGTEAGAWTAEGQSADLAGDQRPDDAFSLTFDSEPLEEPLEILGFPEAVLELAVDRPNALVAVRLCDVFPDGTSALVTRGLLNLTHRDSHEHVSPLEPGRRYEVRVPLDVMAYAVPAGHRLRVAVSPTYWPWAWPSPEPVTLTLYSGRLDLPERPPRAEDAQLPDFGRPESAPSLAVRGGGRLAAGPLHPPRARHRARRAGLRLGPGRRAALRGHRPRVLGHEPHGLLHPRGRPALGRGALPCDLGHGPRRLEHALGGDERDDLRRARPSTSRRSSRSTSATRPSSRAPGSIAFRATASRATPRA